MRDYPHYHHHYQEGVESESPESGFWPEVGVSLLSEIPIAGIILLIDCTSSTKLKLKTNLYTAIKSEDSEALDGGTSQLSSQSEYGEIKMF